MKETDQEENEDEDVENENFFLFLLGNNICSIVHIWYFCHFPTKLSSMWAKLPTSVPWNRQVALGCSQRGRKARRL